MSEYAPIEPGGSPKKSGVAGCLLGCIVAAAAVVAIVVAAGTFVGWKLTRPIPSTAEVGLRDGTESLFVHARLEPDDPGLNALAAGAAAVARDVARSRNGGLVIQQGPESQNGLDALPVEIDVVRRERRDGSETFVAAILVEGRPRMARAAFRIMAYVVPKEKEGGVRRIDREGRTTIVAEKTATNARAPEFAVTMVGDRIVAARDLETLEAALQGTVPAGGTEDEPSALAAEVRIDGETGWGYTRPRGVQGDDAVRLAVVSFDLAGEDLVRWRAALRSERAPKEKEASAQARVAAIAGISLPASMKITLDRTTRWIDDRTLVVEGTLDGIQGAVRELFSAHDAKITNESKAEPGTEPASPSP